MAYLNHIATQNDREIFDPLVVDALWIGNSLLENITYDSTISFLKNLLGKTKKATHLCDTLPKGLVLHHSFNSLFVNFVSDKVTPSVENFDSCCINFGKVIQVQDQSAVVLRSGIIFENNKFILTEKTEKVTADLGGISFVKNLKKNDLVSLHWGMIIEKISISDSMNLKKYTQINIDVINSTKSAFSIDY